MHFRLFRYKRQLYFIISKEGTGNNETYFNNTDLNKYDLLYFLLNNLIIHCLTLWRSSFINYFNYM